MILGELIVHTRILSALLMLRSSPNNQLADRIAKGGEFLLVLGHDIALIHCIVMVEVIGAAPHMEGGRDIDLRDGEVEEQPVIRLEFDRAVFCKDSVITGKELPGGKPPSGMPCLGPGIGEVQIDPVNLARSKYVRHIAGIHTDEADVGWRPACCDRVCVCVRR